MLCTFWGALVLTKLLWQKEDWLLLYISLNQYGSCTRASFLNLHGSATLCCPIEDSVNPSPLNRVLEDDLLWKGHSIPSSFTSGFSEQLVFSSMEIHDACWIFLEKIVKTFFPSSPWTENSPYPLPAWHVHKYNLLSLLAAIQIMGFILPPTQMAVTESGQEGRWSERKHMKLYRQDLKGKDR